MYLSIGTDIGGSIAGIYKDYGHYFRESLQKAGAVSMTATSKLKEECFDAGCWILD